MNKKCFPISISAAVICAALASCSNPEGDLKKAEQVNTEEAYQEFIQKHPDSPLVAQVQAELEKVVFAAAKREGTSMAFEKFLSRFPKSPLVQEARDDLENAAYQETQRSDTFSGYQTLLDRFPHGKHTSEANEKLALLVWNEVNKTNTISAYESFLSRFSATSIASQASNALEKLQYQAATNGNTIEDYQRFLQGHPNSEFATDVKKQLEPQLEERDWNRALLENTTQSFVGFHALHPNSVRLRVMTGTVRGRYWCKFVFPFQGEAALLIKGFQSKPGQKDGIIVTVKDSDMLVNVPLAEALRLDLIRRFPLKDVPLDAQSALLVPFGDGCAECAGGGVVAGSEFIVPKDSPNSTLILSEDGTRVLACEAGQLPKGSAPDQNPTFIEKFKSMPPFNE